MNKNDFSVFIIALLLVVLTTFAVITKLKRLSRDKSRQIVREAVESINRDDLKVKALENNVSLEETMNPNTLTGANPVFATKNGSDEYLSYLEYSEKSFLCPKSAVRFNENDDHCVYPTTCHACSGRIYWPEVKGASPICADGSKAEDFKIVCCPVFNDAGIGLCPATKDCIEAENPQVTGCPCGPNLDCRAGFNTATKQIECICPDETL